MRNTSDDSLRASEALARGHVIAAITSARAWARSGQRPIWGLLYEMLAHLVRPLAWRMYWTDALGERARADGRTIGDRVASAFLLRREHSALWCAEQQRRMLRARSLGQRSQFRFLNALLASIDAHGMQSPSEMEGIVVSYPFVHRPLLSYALSLGAGIAAAPGQPRLLMKAAFRELLPTRIHNRFSKVDSLQTFRLRAAQSFARAHADRVEQLLVIRRGYLDPSKVAVAFQSITAPGPRRYGNILEILALERWLQALEQHRIHVETTAAA
jgi:hypothetical protein